MKFKQIIISATLLSFAGAPLLQAKEEKKPAKGSGFDYLGDKVHPYFKDVNPDNFLVAGKDRNPDDSINKTEFAKGIAGALILGIPAFILGGKAMKQLEDVLLRRKKAKHKETDQALKEIVVKALGYAMIGITGSFLINKYVIGQNYPIDSK